MNTKDKKMIESYFGRMHRITESSHEGAESLATIEAKEEREHRRFMGTGGYNAPIVRIAEYFAVKHILDGLTANYTARDFLGIRQSCLIGAGIADKFRTRIEAEFTPAEIAAFAELDYCELIK